MRRAGFQSGGVWKFNLSFAPHPIRWGEGGQRSGEGNDFRIKNLPQFIRAFRADARMQLRDALERNFIARIYDEFQICRCILEMCLFKKSYSAGNRKWNLSLH